MNEIVYLAIITILLLMLLLKLIAIEAYKKYIKKLQEELLLSLKKENYLLKTMNDATKVVDVAHFMQQRMKMAPKEFKAKTEEEVNPDNISG